MVRMTLLRRTTCSSEDRLTYITRRCDASLVAQLPIASRYRLIQHVTSMFWNKWSTNVSPGLVVRQKWHAKSRNMREGDLVMICELSPIKSKYKLGVVDSVHPSGDNLVRSVTIRYVNIKNNPNGDGKKSLSYTSNEVYSVW